MHGSSEIGGRVCIEGEPSKAVEVPRDASRAPGARSLAEALARIEVLESRLADQARRRAELVQLVSHELRTPITVISGFARLLYNDAHGRLNASQQRFVNECLKACERLDDFVSDLLEARPDATAPFRVAPAPASLHRMIEAQVEALAPLLEERAMQVEMLLRADEAPIVFDERRIGQVVTNLMTNAIRYARPEGVIRIETRDRRDAAVPFVEVAIEDDGEGIAEADRERVFEPYVRGAGREDSAGLGIGLALCRRIVEAHRGGIRVESGALGGARFVFEWPRAGVAGGKDVEHAG
jgi:signal transduction histidine kinase